MISLTSPVRTRAHDWPAGAKLAGLSVATIGLFYLESLPLQALVLVGVLALYALPGRRFFAAGLRQLRILWPFVLIVGIWHLWAGDPAAGAVISLRLVSAVALANLVTMTTRLSDMTDALHRITGPLARLGLRPRTLDLAMALVIRMTPVLIAKGRTLTDAWRARATARAGWRIVLPFTVLALDDADHVAEALKARGAFTTQD